ncbi:MAG: hypothetical protein LBN97_08875 [Oscillospiraceae bacterium]|jgi:hypothetical protein|nr:hypothetical protein [Oscillospiraceae bacterium]
MTNLFILRIDEMRVSYTHLRGTGFTVAYIFGVTLSKNNTNPENTEYALSAFLP